MAEQYGGALQQAGQAQMPAGSGLGLDGVNVREAIPEIFHGLEDAGIRIAGLGKITIDGDSIRIYVPLDHGVPCAPSAEAPADGGMWIRATKVNVDRGEIRWYVAIDVGDLAHMMYVDTATTGWTKDQKQAALAGLPDVPSSYNDSGVRDRLLDTQPDSLRDAAKLAADRLGISDGAVTSAVDVTAQHRHRLEVAAEARATATAREAGSQSTPSDDADADSDSSPPDDADADDSDDETTDETAPPPADVDRPLVAQQGNVSVATSPTLNLTSGATFATPAADLTARYGLGPASLDTGHYDDGHSFAWPSASPLPHPVPLTGDASMLDDLVAEIEARLADPNELPSAEEISTMTTGLDGLYPQNDLSETWTLARDIRQGLVNPAAALQRLDRIQSEVEAWQPVVPLLSDGASIDGNDRRLDLLADVSGLRAWVVAHTRPKGTAVPGTTAAAPRSADLFTNVASGDEPSPSDNATADPDLDTGHYDDGHSFGWDQSATPTEPSTDGSDDRVAGGKRVLVAVGGVLAVLLIAVVAVVAIGGGGGGGGKDKPTQDHVAADDDADTSEQAPQATTLAVPYGSATIVSSEYNPARTSTVAETPPTLQVECSRSECTLLFRGTRIAGKGGAFTTTIDESPVAQPNCPPDRHYTDTFDVHSTGTVERQGIRFPAKLTGTVTRSIPRVDVALANGSTICFGQTTVYSIDSAPSA